LTILLVLTNLNWFQWNSGYETVKYNAICRVPEKLVTILYTYAYTHIGLQLGTKQYAVFQSGPGACTAPHTPDTGGCIWVAKRQKYTVYKVGTLLLASRMPGANRNFSVRLHVLVLNQERGKLYFTITYRTIYIYESFIIFFLGFNIPTTNTINHRLFLQTDFRLTYTKRKFFTCQIHNVFLHKFCLQISSA
jgi:hypothetical protein